MAVFSISLHFLEIYEGVHGCVLVDVYFVDVAASLCAGSLERPQKVQEREFMGAPVFPLISPSCLPEDSNSFDLSAKIEVERR